MEAKTGGERIVCVILWKIVNLSHCWLKEEEEEIRSSTFNVEALQNTKFYLSFKPFVKRLHEEVGIRLNREKSICDEPDIIDVIYKLGILFKDGSSLIEGKWEDRLYTGHCGWSLHVGRHTIFGSRRDVLLPGDTLTIQCILFSKDKASVKPEEIYIQTVFNVKRRHFAWKITDFSKRIRIKSNKFKDESLELNFSLKEGPDFDLKLNVDVVSFHESIKYILIKVFVINSSGKKKYQGNFEFFEDDLIKKTLSKTLSTRMLIENKSRYLPNDILSMDCECFYSTGTITDQFCCYGMSVS